MSKVIVSLIIATCGVGSNFDYSDKMDCYNYYVNCLTNNKIKLSLNNKLELCRQKRSQ